MTWQTCSRPKCKARAHVRIVRDDIVVCWTCWNAAVLSAGERLEAKMLRRYYR